MELLIAFLIAFGVVDRESVEKFADRESAYELIKKGDLDKEYIIWAAEADDF